MQIRVVAGQVALVAGGGPGAAAAAARALARAGVEVHLAVRPAASVPPGALGLGRILAAPEHPPDPAVAVERLMAAAGRLDAFVYIAAPSVVAPFAQLDPAAWSRGVVEPLVDLHRWVQPVMAHMRLQRYGTVVLVGPAGSLEPQDDRVAPAALGGALRGLVEALAYAGLRWNIRCHAIRIGARAVDLGTDPERSWLATELGGRLLELLAGGAELPTGGVVDVGGLGA